MVRYLCIGDKSKSCPQFENHQMGHFCPTCQKAYWTDQPENNKKDCVGVTENAARREKKMAIIVNAADAEYKKSVERGIINHITKRG